ncbi:oligosaccharide flippase family protein (plasmid) [Limimaricola variabilis]|uniref:oligosaccharide flippase family protein n=1 Tax=Limimaricola variabilis TaxID=1492771 RepID=UPI002AC91F0C|nr:oligosaccharide flippase family protein [Limimaricola variabilis]WPY96656.1 oligosaccharide flippase family protein [Limimaricola variabilis]
MTARGLEQVSLLVVMLLAARFMLPAEYGVYSIAVIFVTLIQTLTYTGFYHFIITSPADDRPVLDTGFWMLFALGAGGAALLSALAMPLAQLFEAPQLALVLTLLALAQPLASLEAWFAAMMLRRQAVNRHFMVMFAQNAVGLVVGVTLLWIWQSVYALVVFRYAKLLVSISLYALASRAWPGLSFSAALARRATMFSGGLYGAQAMGFLSRYGADLVLGVMFTTAEAGLYRFGNRVASGATDVVVQPMRSFAQTQFGAAGRKGLPMDEQLARFAGTVTVLAGGIAMVIVTFAADIVELVFQPAYLAAMVVTQALAVRAVLAVGPFLLEPVAAGLGRTGMVMRYNMFGAAVSLAAVFAAAPFGLAVLAWSQAVTGGLLTLGAIAVIGRSGGLRTGPALQRFGLALLLTLGYGAVLHLIRRATVEVIADPVTALLAGLALGVLAGFAAIAVAARLRVFQLAAFSG